MLWLTLLRHCCWTMMVMTRQQAAAAGMCRLAVPMGTLMKVLGRASSSTPPHSLAAEQRQAWMPCFLCKLLLWSM
jgi:hypothetical protein